MEKSALLLALAAMTACSRSSPREPTTAELDEICQQVRCRPPTSLALPVDESHVYAVEFPASPWVAGPGLISLLPGETITITGTVDAEDRLQGLRVVDNTSAPTPNTIVLKFNPPELGLMMLRVDNYFDAPLIYKMAMFVPMEDGLFETSAVPVRPKVSSIEMWSHPIIQLALSGFRFERTN